MTLQMLFFTFIFISLSGKFDKKERLNKQIYKNSGLNTLNVVKWSYRKKKIIQTLNTGIIDV